MHGHAGLQRRAVDSCEVAIAECGCRRRLICVSTANAASTAASAAVAEVLVASTATSVAQ